MIADTAGLLAANGLFLLAGLGVLRLARSTYGAGTPWRLALAYVAGIASMGLLAQLLLVLGLPLAAWQVALVSLLLFAAGLAVRSPEAAPGGSGRARSSRAGIVLLLGGAVLGVAGVAAAFEPAATWDAWAFWIPKAKSIVAFDGLSPEFFRAQTTANADYPILVPSLEAMDFRFMRTVDTQVVHLQFWLVLVGFLGSLPALLGDRVRQSILLPAAVTLMCAPSLVLQMGTAYADVPLGIFFAVAGIFGWRWLVLGEGRALPLFGLFSAAAMATKTEGRLFVAALVVSLLALSVRGSRRRAGQVASAGIVAAAFGVLPWSVWLRAHHVHGLYHADLRQLGSHAGRVAPATLALVGNALDPLHWLFVVPLGLAAVVVGWRVDVERRGAALVACTFLLCLAGLVFVYWATPYEFAWHLRTSADRVVVAPVLFLAVLTPFLLESILRAAPEPEPAPEGAQPASRRSLRAIVL
jgi:hypothetical protein